MDLITLVIFCNCTIAIGCLILTLWTMRLRQQLVAITQYCDRWADECTYLSTITPEALMGCRDRIRHLRRIYQQQVAMLDFADRRLRQRVQAMGLFIQIVRSLMSQRAR